MIRRTVTTTLSNATADYALVDDNLYIGNANSVYDKNFLTANGIKLIINASNDHRNQNNLSIPTIMALDMKDTIPDAKSDSEFTRQYFRKASTISEQIHKYASKGQPVLIHCQAGMNRSAFILAYYLIKKRGYSPDATIAMLRKINKTYRNVNTLTNPKFESMLRSPQCC